MHDYMTFSFWKKLIVQYKGILFRMNTLSTIVMHYKIHCLGKKIFKKLFAYNNAIKLLIWRSYFSKILTEKCQTSN